MLLFNRKKEKLSVLYTQIVIVIKNAFRNGYVKEERCSEVKIGKYPHFHPCYQDSNGDEKKRYGHIDGFKISIHGFYGVARLENI